MKKKLLFLIPMVIVAVLLFMLRATGMKVHITISLAGLLLLIGYTVATKKEWKNPGLEIFLRACYAIALITGIALMNVHDMAVISVIHKISAGFFVIFLAVVEIQKELKKIVIISRRIYTMKKTLSVILTLILSAGLLAGCNMQTGKEENNAKVIRPMPETLDIDALDNCTVAGSIEKGDAFVDDNGKMVMDVTVYSYELYDIVDISALEENDVIIRKNEEVTVTELERLDSGLVRINGGEENGGFDLISNDSTVYYEVGMNDIKAYYELGNVTLPVSDEFEYVDEADLDAERKIYYPGDFLTDDAGIDYNFSPNNTSIVIENGTIIKMNKFYMP